MAEKRQIRYDPDNPTVGGNAHFAATLAGLAYKSQLEIEKGLEEIGYPGTDVYFFRSNLLSCFILRWDDVTTIAFKGSTSAREWLNNMNVWPEATDHGRVHAGFLHTIKRFGPILYHLIFADIRSSAKIVLTGHSRGGAMALLFAFFLALNGRRPHSVWAFGAPKVGDGEFASHWQKLPEAQTQQNSQISRARCHLIDVPVAYYVNGADPIPLVPANIRPRLAITRWLLQFKIIFVSVTLIHTFRVLFPHPLDTIGKLILHTKPIKNIAGLLHSIRSAFSGRR